MSTIVAVHGQKRLNARGRHHLPSMPSRRSCHLTHFLALVCHNEFVYPVNGSQKQATADSVQPDIRIDTEHDQKEATTISGIAAPPNGRTKDDRMHWRTRVLVTRRDRAARVSLLREV